MKRLYYGILTIFLLAKSGAQNLPQRQSDVISAQVEQMYEKGLRFLSSKQNKEGCWDDSQGNEPGVVGLATIAFLAHGEDPNHGPYAKNIRLGIDYIIANQSSTNGYIGSSMYNHGFATLALAEAYGAIEHPKIALSLKKAVELILSSQKRNSKKAWRYTPDANDADTTVSGCQIVALLAARNAGIAVPDEAIQGALAYMDKCRGSDGGYGYTSAGGSRPTLTAIGSLCLSLAKKKDSKGFLASTKYLQNQINYRDPHYPYYLEYYMSQALFHADEKLWDEWNAKNIKLLSTTQSPDGSWPGRMGYAFNTSGALLSLALNYRFLPIYEK